MHKQIEVQETYFNTDLATNLATNKPSIKIFRFI